MHRPPRPAVYRQKTGFHRRIFHPALRALTICSSNIRSTELPATLQSSLKSTYAGYWITGLTVTGSAKHARYSLTLESVNQVLLLHAGKGNAWEVVSTVRRCIC